MPYQSMTEAQRRRATTAVHEAGHAVAAVMAGARIMAVTLHDDDPDTPGSCTFVDLPADKESAVAYAGPWCEARLRFGARPRLEHIKAAIAENPGDHSDLAESGPPLPRDTESLLETCWSTIMKLAATLYGEGRLIHRDITTALGIPLLNGHLSSEAAMIRSGYGPETFSCYEPGAYFSR